MSGDQAQPLQPQPSGVKPERRQLFISYSHRDSAWVERLRTMLRPLEQRYGLERWDDSRIQPGSLWREEFEKALAHARVALLLVSADFLASDFVTRSELPALFHAAKQEGLSILWVPLRPCLWQEIPEIEQYQAAIPPGRTLAEMAKVEQEEAFVQITEAILDAFKRSDQPPLRVLRWRGRTQVFFEELGDGARLAMIRIPAGTFRMGSPEQEIGRDADEGPVHEVTLGEFLMGRMPITQAQWRAVALWPPQEGEQWGREVKPEPSWFQGKEARLLEGETTTDQRPVEQVSWFDAMEFCSRLSQRTGRTYTLPSEAQWEYACRAGTTTPFCFGGTITPELVNYRGSVPYAKGPEGEDRQQTTPVGSFPANAWGLHDMHGNVWEWCLDHWHSSYSGAPRDGSLWLEHKGEKTATKKEAKQGADNTERVVRGGAWSDPAGDCRSGCRYRFPPEVADEIITGFRVVCLPQRVSVQKPDLQGRDHGQEATILWVDDNPDNNTSERGELERLGIKVLQTGSTEEALAVLAGQPIDVIISDMMRHGNPLAGFELLKDLEAHGLSIPVVFYVGMARPEFEAEAMAMGAAAVINRQDELVGVLQSVLKKRSLG